MKEITYYMCEVCGAELKIKEEIEKCEKSHKIIKDVDSAIYEKWEKYPTSILVQFHDGTIKEYVPSQYPTR